ncbi:hypothetical protein M8818_001508 [Zalaria obscura]|uniref:Uncharacterized protein n=1 Tax=Zalaria obscura TaxID=2024903 RepID=A0ACC3SKN0_9PEZI
MSTSIHDKLSTAYSFDVSHVSSKRQSICDGGLYSDSASGPALYSSLSRSLCSTTLHARGWSFHLYNTLAASCGGNNTTSSGQNNSYHTSRQQRGTPSQASTMASFVDPSQLDLTNGSGVSTDTTYPGGSEIHSAEAYTQLSMPGDGQTIWMPHNFMNIASNGIPIIGTLAALGSLHELRESGVHVSRDSSESYEHSAYVALSGWEGVCGRVLDGLDVGRGGDEGSGKEVAVLDDAVLDDAIMDDVAGVGANGGLGEVGELNVEESFDHELLIQLQQAMGYDESMLDPALRG